MAILTQKDYQKLPTETTEQYNARIAPSYTPTSTGTTTGGVPLYSQPGGTVGLTSIANPIPAPTNTTSPTPPIPQADAVRDSYFGSSVSAVDTARVAQDSAYKQQIDLLERQRKEAQAQMDSAAASQQANLENVKSVTQPFREKLETAERERLHINENFEANQKLTNELGDLLQQGNDLIARKRNLPILASIGTANLNKTIEDVAARAGLLQATMAARNNQISVAENMIDRSVFAINADRQDQLVYFRAINDFYQNQKDEAGNRVMNLTKDQRAYINAQISTLENDLTRAQDNADYIKKLMTNPESASFMARAGVTLNMTPEQVNQAMAKQSDRDEVDSLKNQMVGKGFEFVPFPKNTAGLVAQTVGGQTLYFKPPPEKEPTPTAIPGNRLLTTIDAKRIKELYGFTPPIGIPLSTIEQYIQDNPDASPEELQRGINEVLGTAPKETDQFLSEDYFRSNFTKEELKKLSDTAGTSRWWSPASKDIDRFFVETMVKIDTARDAGYSDDEILEFLGISKK